MELTRTCQKNAHKRITELLATYDKCLVKMFCGTGKSRVIRSIILTHQTRLSIVVFPSLALIRQFTADYLADDAVSKICAILNVSSEQLRDFQSTTEPVDIKEFIVSTATATATTTHKFAIQGYDHIVEEGSTARAGNIADLSSQEEDESTDICIYSQSLMGSDWRDYLTEGHRMLRYNGEFIISEHIKMLDDVRAELDRLGCKVESVNADAIAFEEAEVESQEADDKVAKWFVLVARKV